MTKSPIDIIKITSGTIAASGTYTSAAIFPNSYGSARGYASIQLTVAGTGTLKVEVLASNDGTNYQEADSAADVMTGKTAGTYIASMTIPLCQSFKVKFTETGGANSATATAYVALQ